MSGCSAFMLARGALCRPDLGAATQAFYRNAPSPAFGWEDVQLLLSEFLARNCELYDARYAVNPVKQWLVYLKVYYPQAAALFSRVKRITDPTEMAAVLSETVCLARAA
jgi:tRNA-dihydrouridine synthase C